MKMMQCARQAILFAALSLAGCTIPANGGSTVEQCSPGQSAGKSAAGIDQVALCVTSKAKTHKFTVEVAATSLQQTKGLMFRTELADTAGMVFPFPEDRMASFWMKNTVIPLDIIFVRDDGTIESIAANTVPYSTIPVESGEPVAAVLELRGGLSAELKIKPGDTVKWVAD